MKVQQGGQKPPNRGLLVVLGVVAGALGLCVVVGVVGAIIGIGSDDKPGAAPPAGDTTSAVAAGGIPPTPGPDAWAAYIKALKAIDPAIVGDKDEKTIVNRGRDQCSSVKEWPNDQAKLIDLTNRRFTAPGHPDGFGKAKAEAILAAVREHICPTY